MKLSTINSFIANHGSTTYLKLALVGGGILTVFFSSLLAYSMYNGWPAEFPDVAYLKYPITSLAFLIMVTVLAGLWQGYKLLQHVDDSNAFSEQSIRAVRNMKQLSIVLGAWFVLGMPVVYAVAEKDDAPGLILLGMIFVAVPFSIAVFAALVQKLLQSAIDYKRENELTV